MGDERLVVERREDHVDALLARAEARREKLRQVRIPGEVSLRLGVGHAWADDAGISREQGEKDETKGAEHQGPRGAAAVSSGGRERKLQGFYIMYGLLKQYFNEKVSNFNVVINSLKYGYKRLDTIM